MMGGKLDRRITLQRKILVLTPSGDQQETWITIAANRPASVRPVAGTERYSGEQLQAIQQVEFRIRWSAAVQSIGPLDRILYPVFARPIISFVPADLDVNVPIGTVVGQATLNGNYTGTPNWMLTEGIEQIENIDDQTDIYDVIAVNEIGRREGLSIIASRQPDIAPIAIGTALPPPVILFSGSTIDAASPVGTVVGTANLTGVYTGTPVWTLSEG